jgi:hypothetical protein
MYPHVVEAATNGTLRSILTHSLSEETITVLAKAADATDIHEHWMFHKSAAIRGLRC